MVATDDSPLFGEVSLAHLDQVVNGASGRLLFGLRRVVPQLERRPLGVGKWLSHPPEEREVPGSIPGVQTRRNGITAVPPDRAAVRAGYLPCVDDCCPTYALRGSLMVERRPDGPNIEIVNLVVRVRVPLPQLACYAIQ